NRGILPDLILINAYGNGGVNRDLIKFALKVIGPKRELVLVTAYDADTGEPPAPHTDVLVRAARDHPEQIKLLNWVRYSLPHHKVNPKIKVRVIAGRQGARRQGIVYILRKGTNCNRVRMAWRSPRGLYILDSKTGNVRVFGRHGPRTSPGQSGPARQVRTVSS